MVCDEMHMRRSGVQYDGCEFNGIPLLPHALAGHGRRAALEAIALIIARRGEYSWRSPSCVRRSVHNQPVSFLL